MSLRPFNPANFEPVRLVLFTPTLIRVFEGRCCIAAFLPEPMTPDEVEALRTDHFSPMVA